MVYEILGEIKHFLFLFAKFPPLLGTGDLNWKKDLEIRTEYTLNIEVLISFDANGI